jgi:uncharacterized protein (TIGR02246 family)
MSKSFMPRAAWAKDSGVGAAFAADDASQICTVTGEVYISAANALNASDLASLFAPEGVFITPDGFFQGHRAIADYMAALLKPGFHQEPDVVKGGIRRGDVTIGWGQYALTFAPGFPIAKGAGNFTKVISMRGEKFWIDALTIDYGPGQMP